MDEKEILTAYEFAECAGIHYNTVRKMIKSGRLSAFKIGIGGRSSDWRIPRSEIHRLALTSLESVVNNIIDQRSGKKDTKNLKRFFLKVEKTENCWLWKGALSKSGYGVFSFDQKYIRAHRASYILHKGKIPENLLVLHSCDVRNCVNPDHLHIGTPQDNMNEMMERNRSRNLKGIEHPSAKLTDQQVSEIRELRNQKIPAKEIAKIFNISFEYVYQIAKGIYRK